MPRAQATTQRASLGPATSIALVANPDSRGCDPALCAERLRAFGAEVELFELQEVGRAAAAGADRLAVAGGDGSIAPAAAAAGRNGVPLAVLAQGTANDFARRLGLPLDLAAACRLAVRGTRTGTLELGWIDERPFVNVASAGLPAPAARAARPWKRRLGALGYAAGALWAGATMRALPVRVECDGRVLFEGMAWQVTAAASGAFGAGATIDEADPHDGALEVVAVEAGPRPGLVALAYRLRAGSLSAHRRASHTRCSSALLSLPEGTELNVDGELVPAGPDARLRGEARAFRLVVA
jgi:diacylglycerol kinase (ATP)